MKKIQTFISGIIFISMLFLILMPISAPWLFTNSGDKSDTPQSISELRTRVDNLMKKFKIPGIGIALVSKDSFIWTDALGTANIQTGESVTTTTLFRAGSCTKSFLGLAFLKLVEEGKINLNTPVKNIVPEIEIDNRWEATHPVRIVHLLEHTAGFDDLHPNALNNQEDSEMSLKKALEFTVSARVVRWEPGTRYSYSSPGYTLAGYILEKVTGEKYEDYIKEVILDPIGMTSSTLRYSDADAKILATGYLDQNETVPFFEGYDRPSASLITSTNDMALFIQFMLNSGKSGKNQIISVESFKRIGKPTTTVAALAGLNNGYSYGIGIHFQNGFKWYGHSGGGPGCIAKYYYLPDAGLGYVIIANKFSVSEFDKINKLIQDYLTRNLNTPTLPQLFTNISSDQLNKYCGYYEKRNPRQKLTEFLDILMGGTTISFVNDTLYQQDFLDSKKALLPVSKNMFRKSSETEASSIFTTTAEGKEIYATVQNYYEKVESWKAFVNRALFFGALIIMLSTIIYAFVWIPIYLFRKLLKKKTHSAFLRMRAIPLVAVLSITFGFVAISNQSLITMGQATLNNIIFYISTILFAGLSILSLVYSYIGMKKSVSKISIIYSCGVSLACFGMTLYLGYWRIIGLRIWAY